MKNFFCSKMKFFSIIFMIFLFDQGAIVFSKYKPNKQLIEDLSEMNKFGFHKGKPLK
jgi:hypothetical protein